MANRFFVNGGVDNNWGTSGNWSASSGGAGGETVPTAADDVFLDGNSPDCTLDTSDRAALTLTCTGYTNTLTFSQNLTVHGNITLAAGMAFAGASRLIMQAGTSLTSAGVEVTVPFEIGGTTRTITLADTWDVTTLRLNQDNATTITVNNNGFMVSGDLTLINTAGTSLYLGSAVITIDGTGAWTTGGAFLAMSLTINTAGTFTVSGTVRYRGSNTLTYTAGTVVTTGSTLQLGPASPTLDTAGMSWNNVQVGTTGIVSGAVTVTLASDLDINGNLSFAPSTATTVALNGNQATVAGNLTMGGSGSSATATGTTVIVLDGTGTWSNSAALDLRHPVTINTAGTITLSGTVRWNAKTLTYVAGTVTSVSSGTLFIDSSTATIIDFNGGTLDADLTINGGGIDVSLASGLVIATGRTFRLTGTSGASRVDLLSTVGGTQRAFTLQAGVATNIRFFTSTDMDSSGGQTVIWRAPGTLSNTINWAGAGGGAGGGGRGGSGGGTTQFRPTGASFRNIGNPGVSILEN